MKQLRNSVINTFYVVFAFLVCFLPYCCLSIIINTTRTRNKAVMLLNLYSTSIILFNSSLNPFIYWWRRREFRETVKQTFTNPCCWKFLSKVLLDETQSIFRTGGRLLSCSLLDVLFWTQLNYNCYFELQLQLAKIVSCNVAFMTASWAVIMQINYWHCSMWPI